MPEDTDYYNNNAYPSQPTQMAPPPVPTPQPQYQQDTRMQNTDEEDEEEQRIRERTEARRRAQQAQAEAKGGSVPMKIKENYQPRAAARAANKQNMATCQLCSQQMPVNELAEHMRSKSPPYPISRQNSN
jgi:splicing factor 3A subunit 1